MNGRPSDRPFGEFICALLNLINDLIWEPQKWNSPPQKLRVVRDECALIDTRSLSRRAVLIKSWRRRALWFRVRRRRRRLNESARSRRRLAINTQKRPRHIELTLAEMVMMKVRSDVNKMTQILCELCPEGGVWSGTVSFEEVLSNYWTVHIYIWTSNSETTFLVINFFIEVFSKSFNELASILIYKWVKPQKWTSTQIILGKKLINYRNLKNTNTFPRQNLFEVIG